MQMIRALLMVLAVTGFARAQGAAYVGGNDVNTEFEKITSAHMDQIRGKKVLFGTRSFGMNIGDGLGALQGSDAMYALNRRWNIRVDGDDTIPADVFDTYDVVHFICRNSPHSWRVEYLDSLVRNHFGNELDAILLFPYKYSSFDNQDYYFNMLDSLQKDFPHIKVIYCGNNIYPEWTPSNYETNKSCTRLRMRGLDRCYGTVPYYDHLDVLSTTVDGSVCGFTENDTLFRVMCADYNNGTDLLHPNTAAGELRLGKSFLLMLARVFCADFNPDPDSTAPSAPSGLQAAAVSPSEVNLSWYAASDVESGVQYYRVYRDGDPAGSAHGTSFNDDGLVENTVYAYTVTAVTGAGLEGPAAGPVTCTTLSDTTRPVISLLADTRDSIKVTVTFSEPLESGSAEDAGNYAVSHGVSVLSASLSGSNVTLTTTALPSTVVCTLYVFGVTDASSGANPVAAGTYGTFRYAPMAYTDDAVVSFSFEGNLDEDAGSGVSAKWNGVERYGAGRFGQGLNFDMDSLSYVIIDRHAALDGYTAMTVSLWAARAADTTGGKLYLKHTVYDLNLTATGVNGYVFNTAGDRGSFGGSADIADTDWHLFTLTFDGSSVRVYVDDAQVAEAALAGTVAVQSRDIYLGRNPWGDTFDGRIDEFRLFDRCLDSLEVAVMYGGGTASGNADSLAVRAILDANGKKSTPVSAVADWEGERVVRLQFNEMGITDLTGRIGELDALRELYAYGDTALGFPYLKSIPAEIGACTSLVTLAAFQNEIASLPDGLGSLPHLATLNLADNRLASLPDGITGLRSLTTLSLAANRLCSLSGGVRIWADTYDPDWEDTQDCTGAVNPVVAGRRSADMRILVVDGVIRIAGVAGAVVNVYGIDGTRLMRGMIDGMMVYEPERAGVYLVRVIVDGRSISRRITVIK